MGLITLLIDTKQKRYSYDEIVGNIIFDTLLNKVTHDIIRAVEHKRQSGE